MRLVGRDPELGELQRAAIAVAAGESRTLGIFGEAGIGKSALLDAAAEAAAEQGLQVLSGRAAEHEREVPFSLVVDALDERVAAMNPARLAAVGGELGRVLPAAADGVEPVLAAGPAERFRYHRTLRALLEQLGRERPFALLLDDLHWADEASLELVLHLLRRTPQVPHLLVFGLRPLEPAARLIDAARSAPGWVELRPGPLAEGEALELLSADLDPALRGRMVAEAGGNPLLLRELGRLGADARGELPSTVLAAVRREVSGLPPEAAALLAGAAVAGDPFDPDLAAAAADTPLADLPAALDRLAAADLVHPQGSGRSLRFRHPLVRRAVYEGIPAGTRLAAHRRAAAALAERGAEPAARAYHVECFAQPGEAEAIEVLVAAAEAASDTAPGSSAHWYGTALDLLPRSDPRRGALLPPLGRALASTGRLPESFAALEEAIALVPAEAAAERAKLVSLLATIAVLLGDYERAEAEIDRELRVAPPIERPALLLRRASTAFFNGEMEEIGEWADRAAAELDPDEQPAVQVEIESTVAIGRLWRGRPAGELLEAALERFDDLEDAQLEAGPTTIWSLGGNLVQAERFEAAARVLRRGIGVVRASRADHLVMHFNLLVSRAELPLLELDHALEHIEEAEEAARLEQLQDQLAMVLWQRAQILTARGDALGATQAAEESDRLYADLPESLPALKNRAYNATVRHGDDPQRLFAELETFLGKDLDRFDVASFSGLVPALARAAVASGRVEWAEAWATATARRSAAAELPAGAARATRAQVEAMLANGDAAGALDAADSAARLAAAAGARQEELQLELAAGRALLAAGRREEGVERLQLLAAAAADRSAFGLFDAASRELRRAGTQVKAQARRAEAAARGEEAGDDPRDALTPRELEVAELVAAGASNKKVAGALFLSEKTVEHHLSRIYAKLEVRTRVELARLLG